MSKQSTDTKKTKPRQPKQDKPHAGVDRRKKDMGGRKYRGTTWSKY
jgi:hypothetical protein